jgi:hypothetical protein
LTELSSALLGLLGDVPGCAVVDVLPFWFHWLEFVEEPEVPELEVPLEVLLPELVLEPVAEVSPLMPLEFVSVVLHAARPKHRAAAKRALVMVMMYSFSVS